MSSDIEDSDDTDTKEILLKNLKKMHSRFIDSPDNNILGNCLLGVVFARNDDILSEEYADKLIVWISKWACEKTEMPPDSGDYELFTSEKKLGDGRFTFQGTLYNVDDFNKIVPIELRETILQKVVWALNRDKKAESISLMKTQPIAVFTGDIPDILQIIDISKPKK